MLRLKLNALEIPLSQGLFSDGALRLKLQGSLPRVCESASIYVTHDRDPQNTYFEIAAVVDIVRSMNPRIKINLFMPYLPYARQDRRMEFADSFTLRLFTDNINRLELDSVLIFDSHSDVGTALLKNCVSVPQSSLIQSNPFRYELTKGEPIVVVAPDAGALKKVHGVQAALSIKDVVVLDKERDVTTGEIKGMRIVDSPFENLEGRRLVIFDDICDGGATFVGAAKALKEAGASSVELVVTHGIFGRGTDLLLNSGIDQIFTTDSVQMFQVEKSDKVHIFSCEHMALNLNYGRLL